jgi:hypothetical protein
VPRRLGYTNRALADLDATRRWLTQPGAGTAAQRKLAAIRADIRRLKQHPCQWPVGEHPGVRELPCAGGYRVLYEVIPTPAAARPPAMCGCCGYTDPARTEAACDARTSLAADPACPRRARGAGGASREFAGGARRRIGEIGGPPRNWRCRDELGTGYFHA